MDWVIVAYLAAALIVGIAKTSFGGLGSVAVALLALAMPAKESTAAALILLICGDLVAVFRYRSNADWRLLRSLLPSVIPGILLGAGFLAIVNNLFLKRSIGIILLIMLILQLVAKIRMKPGVKDDSEKPATIFTVLMGMAAGFTTMAANAAGPVMALYLQLARVDKLRFLGTSAWFYLIVNLSKTPLTLALGLFTPMVLKTALLLLPLVLIGTVVGVWVIKHISQEKFDIITLLTSVVAAAALIML